MKIKLRQLKNQILVICILCSTFSVNAQWLYRDREDPMRGKITRMAVAFSTNIISLPFPYEGETKLAIAVFQDNKSTSVSIKTTKGQLSCSVAGCWIFAKFDDKKIINFNVHRDSNGNSDTLWFEKKDQEKLFLKNLRESNSVQVEVSYFRSGVKQFKFDISDLNI